MAKAAATKTKAKKTVAKATVKKVPVKKAAKAVKVVNPTTFLPVLLASDQALLIAIEELQERLADALNLALQAKVAHWNIRGPNFIAVHELLDKVAEQLHEAADLIAERIGQLGEIAQGNFMDIDANSILPIYIESRAYKSDKERAGWEVMLFGMAYGLASFSRQIQVSQEVIAEYEDRVTDDILTEIRRGLDKQAWFLESHTRAIGSV